MFKRIIISLAVVLIFSLLGAYFYFAGELSAKEREKVVCNSIDVVIIDSLENKLLDKASIVSLLKNENSPMGMKMRSINTHSVEDLLSNQGEIAQAEVFTLADGTLRVEIVQREPAIRFDNGKQKHYADKSGYIFPLLSSAKVPIICGNFPLSLENSFKGYPQKESLQWVKEILSLTSFIENNSYWREQIEQISVDPNGDIILGLRSAQEVIIFGDCSQIEAKFKKLAAYYKSVVPHSGSGRYKTVNLKYKNQIICK